ncbi:MAG: hypothetical protein GY710_02050 [Desulfobacteraceae bacterium]|nr:hypothetical protein [Desulfobacteraceae bacterium]
MQEKKYTQKELLSIIELSMQNIDNNSIKARIKKEAIRITDILGYAAQIEQEMSRKLACSASDN